MAPPLKRYDLKRLLTNPELRKKLLVDATVATQAREGITVSQPQAKNSYYVVSEGERASFFGLVPFRTDAGENDGRHIEFVKTLGKHAALSRTDVSLTDFSSIDGAPLAFDRLALVGSLFKNNSPLDPVFASGVVGLQSSDDSRFVRCHWEIPAESGDSPRWRPFAKGGDFSRFYADVYLKVFWTPETIAKMEKIGRVQNVGYYFQEGLTWPRRTAKGLSLRRLPAGCIFADKGPALFPKKKTEASALLGIVNSRLFEFLFTTKTSFSWEVGIMKSMPIPSLGLKKAETERIKELAEAAYALKAHQDTGNEICTRFDKPWVLQATQAGSSTLSSALDRVLDREAETDGQLTAAYAELNDAVYHLYGVSDALRAKIEAAIGTRPPELAWPQMEGKDRDQKRREHVDRLLTYLVKQIVEADDDGLVCLQTVAHEPSLLERLRPALAACFPSQDPTALETEVVNELKKKTKGYRRAESLSEWLHDAFFETHNNLYQQRPILWHLASSQIRTEPGFACLVHAHRFSADALAKLRSVYLADRLKTLRREAAQAGNDGKADLRLDLLALAEEVEAYDAKLALLQEGAHPGPDGGERDYRLLTPWKTPATRPVGWNPDLDDGIKVNLAPLARTNLLRKRLKVGETNDEE